MRYTKNQTEDPSSIKELVSLIKGKTIKHAVDMRKEFHLQLSDDYVLRISGTEVNLLRTTNPPNKNDSGSFTEKKSKGNSLSRREQLKGEFFTLTPKPKNYL
jgi:hypothetical protein